MIGLWWFQSSSEDGRFIVPLFSEMLAIYLYLDCYSAHDNTFREIPSLDQLRFVQVVATIPL